MIAAFTGVADLELDKDESAQLAKAIAEVGEHYGMAAAFDPKTVAWINLGQTVIAIYGTRVMTYRLNKRMARDEAAKARAREPQPVVQRSNTDANSNPLRTPTAEANIPGLGKIEVDL